jgi:hypothetical protein
MHRNRDLISHLDDGVRPGHIAADAGVMFLNKIERLIFWGFISAQ